MSQLDRTLRSFLEQADQTHTFLDTFFIALNHQQIEEKIISLQASIKILQSISYQLANVSNIAARALRRKSHVAIKYIDPYPSDSSLGVVRNLYQYENKEIVKGVTVPVKVVESEKDIQPSPLYYISELKQYAVNINGIILRGNLGNIVPYQTEHSANCEYGTECKSFKKNTICPYYHDPTDYIKLGKVPPDIIKNFTVGSWLYSQTKNPRTYFTRHLGSKESLIHDLNTLKKVQYLEEISNREGQLIHDLIILMILSGRGLLERYPHFGSKK